MNALTVPRSSDLEAASVGTDNDFYGVTTSVSGIITNSNSSLPVPQTWADLEKSVYDNKIAMLDPTAIGQMADIFAHLNLSASGPTIEKGLKANNAETFPSSSITGPLTAVAQGAKGVALAMGYHRMVDRATFLHLGNVEPLADVVGESMEEGDAAVAEAEPEREPEGADDLGRVEDGAEPA